MKKTILDSKDGGAFLSDGQPEIEAGKAWTPATPPENQPSVKALSFNLTNGEASRLEELEKVVADGWDSFLSVGRALIEIQNKKLYRENHGTFEEYFHQRFGLSRTYAYNLIASAEVFDDLSSIEDIRTLPANEAQTRCLIAVPREQRATAWKLVVEKAGEKLPTAKLVQEVASEFTPKTTARKPVGVRRFPGPNLKPGLELVGQIEKLAKNAKDHKLIEAVARLLEWFREQPGG